MKHFYGLDFLRFSCALMVVLYHHAAFGWAGPEYPAEGFDRAFPFIEPFADLGWIGVQVFFVLSGFVISASASTGSCFNFVQRRFVRILPTLWICATIALAIRLLAGDETAHLLEAYARSVTLFPQGPYIDGVIWTLVVEGVFYVIIAVVVLLSDERKQRQASLNLCAIIMGLVSSGFLALEAISPIISPVFNDFMSEYLFTVLLLRHGVFFAFGMLVWSVYASSVGRAHKIGWAAVFSAFCLVQVGIRSGGVQDMLNPAMFWVACMALLVISIVWKDFVTLAPWNEAIIFMGLMTFPLYLSHFTMGMFLTPLTFSSLGSNAFLNWFALAAITLALAWVITATLEPLGQKAMRRLFMVQVPRNG